MPENVPQNGHMPQDDTSELDTLSPGLEMLHARLLDDGAAFRAMLPDAALVTRHALLAVDALDHVTAGDESETALEIWREDLDSATSPTSTRTRRQTRRLPVIAAALAIVGLLAALFASLSPGRLASGPTHPQRTNYLVSGGAWMKVPIPVLPHMLDPTGGNYIAAPSDPSVVYYIDVRLDGTTGYAEEQLSRLDSGQHWVSLSFPLPDVASAPASPNDQKGISYRLDVMPSDPMSLILGLDVVGTASCPIAHPVQYSCDEYFYSSDGGAHWGTLRLPTSGLLAQWLTLDDGALAQPYWNQDGRLYTTLSTADPEYHPFATRIVYSTDNGATWQLPETDLASEGAVITDYMPAPHGTTVYAITEQVNGTSPTRSLWRSTTTYDGGMGFDTAGANTMPTDVRLVGVGPSSSPRSTIVYRDQARYTDLMPRNYIPGQNLLVSPEVSMNGGKVWSPVPLTGLPIDTGGTAYTVGTLADGSLVVVLPGEAWEKTNGNVPAIVTFYAWTPGDAAWRQITSTITDITLSNTVTPSWWLIPDTSSSPARLCVSADAGALFGATWGIACSTLA